jgi:hypothetical protein
MGIYRILWCSVICGVMVAGSVAAWMFLSWQPLLGLGLVAAIFGPLVAAGVHRQTRGTAASLPCLLGASALAVLGVIAVSGLLVLFDVVALLGLGLLVVCSPWALRILLTRAPQARAPDVQSGAPMQPTQLPPPPAPPPQPLLCASLSDAELCWRWRISFGALQHTVSPDQRLHLIETRAALLDELAHRDPEGFTRWLNSGARAASDPGRFVTGTHRRPPAPHERGAPGR